MIPPLGMKTGVNPAVIAAGFKGYIWRVEAQTPGGGVIPMHGRVTGNLTDDGLVEVEIVGQA